MKTEKMTFAITYGLLNQGVIEAFERIDVLFCSPTSRKKPDV